MSWDIAALKQTAFNHLQAVTKGAPVSDYFDAHVQVLASQPVNAISGHKAVQGLFDALRTALPDVERRDQIFVAGDNLPDDRVDTARPAQLVATMGVYQGTFQAPLFDIPPSHGTVTLRFCEVHELDPQTGKICQSWMLWDYLDLMHQVGLWPLPPSLGSEGAWQPPATLDGVHLSTCDGDAGKQAMDQVLKMHAALGQFDGKTLDSMPHADYWTRDFMWYGPSGIGSSRGLPGFRAHHQIPFLKAFPDRAGAGHYIRIGDGNFAVTGGWPSVTATHDGEWLGIGPTGRIINMRVMDFYRIDGDGMIAENWVPIDIIDIALQMGVDVFARLRHMTGTLPKDI